MSTPNITPLNQMGPQTTASDVPNEIAATDQSAAPVSTSVQQLPRYI